MSQISIQLFPAIVLGALLFYGCTDTSTETDSESEVSRSGEELAKAYCGGCHQFPRPEELDKLTWEKGVMPQMAPRFGLYHYQKREELVERGIGGQLVEAANIFPLKPTIRREDFEKIAAYYRDNAPDSLAASGSEALPPTDLFVAEEIKERYNPPMGTMLTSFPDKNTIVYADAKQDYSSIEILDSRFGLVQRLSVPHPVAHLAYVGDTILATFMGQFTPTDGPTGSVAKIFRQRPGAEYTGFFSELKQLQRPLHTSVVDLNQDGRQDLVVCEYGNHTGNLTWYENTGHRKYQRHVLLALPGASKTIIRDFDQDGLPDIMALMAQGDEGVDIHFNQGNGSFKRKRILRFSPLFGSVNIRLQDVNMDGHEDLIYVNGDNADYSMIEKPYHGIRIFINDGENNFKEEYFFALNGAYDAFSADFDQDGDQDILAIAFFPSEAHLDRGVIYLENVTQGDDKLSFRPFSVPGTEGGRWIKMDVNDLNGDGKSDATLLSFTGMPLGNISDEQYRKWLRSPSVLHLRNTGN